MQGVDLAQLAAVGELNRLLKVRHAAALRSCLKNSLFAMHRIGQFLAIGNGDSTWFFAVHILARLSSQDRCRSVPAIAGGNQDCVDVFAIE